MANVKLMKKGKYRVIISLGYDENGKRDRYSKVIDAKDLREAELIADKMEYRKKNGIPIDGEPTKKVREKTFNDAVNNWKNLMEKGDYVRKTLARYYGILDNFLIPYFGNMWINDITYPIIKAYMATLDKNGARKDGKKGGYSESTKNQHKAIILMLLNEAVAWEWIDRSPYTESNSQKRRTGKKKKAIQSLATENFFNIEELKQVFEMVDKIPVKENGEDVSDAFYWQHKMLVHLAYATGLRLSELCGLEFKDIDWENSVIHLHRISQNENGEVYTQNTLKNGNSSHKVTVDNETIDMLKEYKEYMDNAWKEKERQKKVRKNRINYEIVYTDRLFTKHDGSPVNPGTLSSWFTRKLKENGIGHGQTFHGLRHTHAAYLIGNGQDIYSVSRRLGHADIGVTSKYYGHLLPNSDRNCSDIMANIIK